MRSLWMNNIYVDASSIRLLESFQQLCMPWFSIAAGCWFFLSCLILALYHFNIWYKYFSSGYDYTLDGLRNKCQLYLIVIS
jgi:hypothetical protein